MTTTMPTAPTYTITELRSYGTVLIEHDRGTGQASTYEVPIELLPPRTRIEVGATVTPWVPVVVAHRVSYTRDGAPEQWVSLHRERVDAIDAATRHPTLRGVVTDLAELPAALSTSP